MRKSSIGLLASAAFFVQPAIAAEAEVAAAADDAGTAADIVVFGQGETRQVQEVGPLVIAQLAPGSSPIRAIEKLPSVNIQAADAFGNYEWSARVTIRSFSQNQLGFNFDGIPLGDMTYGNHNGLHISRVVSPENIGSVRVTQGAGALGTQSTNNLGGTVETFSMDPKDRMAFDVAATYGSDDTKRAFVRANLGSTDGPRGYVSYAYGSTDKYKGKGVQDQHMVNAKAIIPIGDVTLDGWFSWSDRREQDYQDMSRDMLARLGYSSDNLYPDYATAILLADVGNNTGYTGAPVSNAAAGTKYPGAYTSPDDAYYDAAGLRKDIVAAIGVKAPLGEAANLALRGYYHRNRGMGLWGTPYVPSPNGTPLSMRTTEYEIDRYGVFGSVDFEIGFNKVVVGGWYETNDFNQARRFYAFESRTNPGVDFRDYPKNPFFTQWEFDFKTETLQYFVQDTIELDALKINLGWKGFRVSNDATAVVQATFPQGSIKVQDWFQPSVGAAYSLGGGAEVFASFSQSTRAHQSATTSGPFSTNQAGFDAIRGKLKPETSDTYELGLRYNTASFSGVLGAYLVNFNDRLLSVASGPSIIGAAAALANVGSVRSVGVEAAGTLQMGNGWSLYASYSYTDSTYRDDVVEQLADGTTRITPLKDKTVVDSPKHMARAELNYDQDGAFGRIGANWMSKRYYTYLNDASVPSRLLVDATIGYRFSDTLELQLNANNLFDEQYISTVGSGGFANSDANGTAMTLLVGAPRQFFATVKAGF